MASAVVAQAVAWVQAQPQLMAGFEAALPALSGEAQLATLVALLLATLYLLSLLTAPKGRPPVVSLLPVFGGFIKFIQVRARWALRGPTPHDGLSTCPHPRV
jgi:hypothetical protein